MSPRPPRSHTGRLPPGATVLLATCSVLIMVNVGSLWLRHSQQARAADSVQQASATIDTLRLLRSTLASAESNHLNSLLTGDPRQARLADESARQVSNALQEAASAVLLDPEQAEGYAHVQSMAGDALTAFATALALERTGRHSDAVRALMTDDGRATSARVLDLLDPMIATQQARLVELRQQAFSRDRWAAVIGTVIGGLTLAVAVIFYGLVKRNARGWRGAEAAMAEANDTLEERIAARTARLASLSRYLLDAGEREKAALARELHDELGSNLTAINLDLAAVANQLKTQDPPTAARLTRALKVLKDTVELKRRIIQELRPSMLESLGLVAALSMCCEEFHERTGMPCAMDLPDELGPVDDDAAIALYRVVQEALTNVARHAQASRTEVRLTPGDDMLHLTIIDDGIGISADAMDRPLGHGLLGMRERIARLGGTLSLRTGHPGGTVIEVRVPWRTSTPDAEPPRPEHAARV